MARQRISSGSRFEEVAGYSRAIVDGDWVFVSGTTGFDYKAGTISTDVVEQTHQCFRNIEWALGQAKAQLKDMVRIQIHLTDAADFTKIAPVIGQYCGEARPANTTVISQLIDPRMKIEIEVTARREMSGPPDRPGRNR